MNHERAGINWDDTIIDTVKQLTGSVRLIAQDLESPQMFSTDRMVYRRQILQVMHQINFQAVSDAFTSHGYHYCGTVPGERPDASKSTGKLRREIVRTVYQFRTDFWEPLREVLQAEMHISAPLLQSFVFGMHVFVQDMLLSIGQEVDPDLTTALERTSNFSYAGQKITES